MVAWIKIRFGMQVAVGPGDFGDWATRTKNGIATLSKFFWRCLLWPNSWMDQDDPWHAGRPRLWPHCVRWRPAPPPPKGQPPIFGPCLLYPNGWTDQDGTWCGGGPWYRPHCARWDLAPPPQKGAEAPNFRPIFVVAIVPPKKGRGWGTAHPQF